MTMLDDGPVAARRLRALQHRSARRARADAGRHRRQHTPIEAHAEVVHSGRPDPLEILTAQDATRLPELVPIRHGRMSPTPFTMYRGAAAVMATDLSRGPTTDLAVQLCGDAHLSNFGMFYGPDRRIVIDVNDFDETIPGPFEWDVKRLVASVVIAARENGFDAETTRRAARAATTGYCAGVGKTSQLDPLTTVYERLELQRVIDQLQGKRRKRATRVVRKSRAKTSMRALGKLTDIVDGRRRIVADPPRVIPLDLGHHPESLTQVLDFFERYLDSVPAHRRALLDRYSIVDVAHKIVGVGSVGTRCVIVLLESGDGEPLFMQFKEAGRSVLEPYVEASVYDNQGERVVQGQRLMQTMGDILLGWARFDRDDGTNRDFYFRQLWDGKGSFDIDRMSRKAFVRYADVCGRVLALAHSRSGDAAMIAGYVLDDPHDDTGVSGADFVDALDQFGHRYADVAEADHTLYLGAIRSGLIEVAEG
ncbi:MAG: DUF2252 domain-containing protein [Actinomycetota bacterium]